MEYKEISRTAKEYNIYRGTILYLIADLRPSKRVVKAVHLDYLRPTVGEASEAIWWGAAIPEKSASPMIFSFVAELIVKAT